AHAAATAAFLGCRAYDGAELRVCSKAGTQHHGDTAAWHEDAPAAEYIPKDMERVGPRWFWPGDARVPHVLPRGLQEGYGPPPGPGQSLPALADECGIRLGNPIQRRLSRIPADARHARARELRLGTRSRWRLDWYAGT